MSAISPFAQPEYQALSTQLRQSLVASLKRSATFRSTALEHAFLTIPREMFVPSFYEQEVGSRTMEWRLVAAAHSRPVDYLTAVYQDQPLITQLDERHWPISSSSQPSAMARMLEALDVRPGHRILEIGTGSGYNAALLARLAGDPCGVVTIERDARLAAQANHVLRHVTGSGVTVIVGDGFAGWQPGAPYDRIIATASVSTLPMSWVDQLAPDGKIVMDLQGSLTSGFLIVDNMPEGMTGHFLPEPLYFMPLVTQEKVIPSVPTMAASMQHPCQGAFEREKEPVFPEALFEARFRWFVQWRIPGCQIIKHTQTHRQTGAKERTIVILDPRSQASVRLQRQDEEERWHGSIYGNAPLWEELQYAYEEFVALGKPEQQMYHVDVGKEGPILIIGSVQMPLES